MSTVVLLRYGMTAANELRLYCGDNERGRCPGV